jgi:hypothetical protein
MENINKVGQYELSTGPSGYPVNMVMNLQIVRGLLWVYLIDVST